jgi:hypothetical protein
VSDHTLDDCGCCAAFTAATGPPGNRPGLSAIAYRVGTHAQFKQAMLAALSDVDLPALAPLTTRADDDFSIALLDAWATAADVLTFHQERIANESYLRTATEMRSVLELARMIGYELRPGVAASAHLAFTLEDAVGAPGYATLAVGTKVQSVPGPDEKPQTFETVESLDARAAWNSLVPQQTQLVPPKRGDTDVLLSGVSTNLRPGDGLLLLDGSVHWDFRRVEQINIDPTAGVTRVIWVGKLRWRFLTPVLRDSLQQTGATGVHVYALRQRAALFGYNAPDWRAMSADVRNHYLGPTDTDTGIEWPHFTLADIDAPVPPGSGTGLHGDYYDGVNFNTFKFSRLDGPIDFNWTQTPPDPSLGLTNYSVRWQGQFKPPVSGTYVLETNSDDGVRLWLNGLLLIDNWTIHGATVNQAVVVLNAGQMYAVTLEYFQGPGAAIIQLKAPLSGQTTAVIPAGQLYPPATVPPAQHLYLDAVYASILPQTLFVLASPELEALYLADEVTAASRSGYTLSAKTTRIRPKGNTLDAFNERVREAVVFAAPEELPLAGRPVTDAVQGDAILLDRAVDALPPGRKLVVRGIRAGDASRTKTGELAVLKEADLQSEQTLLRLNDSLTAAYDRTTVTIAANVALSTHGESVTAILGSGDAGAVYQQFTLRESPLTYTAADNPTGGVSTLVVRANDLQWDEVPTLFGHGPHERIYVTRHDADAKTAVLFGTGATGARPPSGRDNVQAASRKGIGHEGLVKAEQLSLLLTRPLGVKAVVNPLPSEGAQDPQALADARRNAPFTVLTLDRVVSLSDYEDFARAFAGIAKARVAWTWNGHARGVFLTVAGPDGSPLTVAGPTLSKLVDALHEVGDPRIPVRVASYRPAFFHLRASVQRDSAYLAANVLADMTAMLQSRFGFEAREFGQALTFSEIMAAIQSVAGVLSVNITQLYRDGTAGGLQTYLPADAPVDGSADAGLKPAELLTIAPDVSTAIEVAP